jgi:GAF domain-containing protein
MTNQLAVAIANAETYSQSQRLARNKVKANEIIAHLQQQADVTSILQVTAQELGKALGAKRARIRLGLKAPSPSGD